MDGLNHPPLEVMSGEQKKQIREIKFVNYRRSKFGPHRMLPQGTSLRQYTSATITSFASLSYITVKQIMPIFKNFLKV